MQTQYINQNVKHMKSDHTGRLKFMFLVLAHSHPSGLTWRAWLARLAWGARDICIRGKHFFTSDLLAKISSIIWQQSDLPKQQKKIYVRPLLFSLINHILI